VSVQVGAERLARWSAAFVLASSVLDVTAYLLQRVLRR
jgi:hypothetical protein